MKKEDKDTIINELAASLTAVNNFYITDIGTLTVEKTNNLRRLCFSKNVQLRVAKNSLIQKALERCGKSDEQLVGILKGSSAIMFCEIGNVPAKLIKEFRKTNDKPILKGAWIDTAVFIGDSQVDTLSKLKSKHELIGEIIGLLQSPAKNVIGALQSGGNKLAGILKTLEERKS